jgi:hypothetical protein
MSSDKKWIQKAIKHPGALHAELGIPKDKKIPVETLKKIVKDPSEPKLLKQRANLAITLKKITAKNQAKKAEAMPMKVEKVSGLKKAMPKKAPAKKKAMKYEDNSDY